MPKLTEKSLAELLGELSSPAPTPGGGSASALAAAIGTALLVMVASLPRSRTGTEEERKALGSAASELLGLRDRLSALVDRDSEAYDRVVAAYRLPKEPEPQKAARSAAIQEALRQATAIPLEVMQTASDALARGLDVARHGHRAAASDIGAGVELLAAGARGAALNVRINLEGLRDRAYAEAVAREVERLERLAAEALQQGRAMMGGG